MANSEQRTANSEQRTANSEQRTANSEDAELGFSNDPLAARQYELLNVLRQVAPELLRDNQLDIDGLKALLGNDWIAPPDHYELSWAGKNLARREIQKTTSHTLLPSPENPVEAQHMLIEGENLEVLRVLQKSYYGKVKMIYIDPPYNTGSDSFVYPDDYSETLAEYQKRTGEKDAAGFLNKQSFWKANSKESGQYHSAWLSMMYPRLFLARNLLREDGVIFISIDDNEAANLKLLCDEIWGAGSFIGTIGWESKTKSQNTKSAFDKLQPKIEYIYVYSNSGFGRFNLLVKGSKQYEYTDENGPYRIQEIEQMNAAGPRGRSTMVYDILGVTPALGKQWQIGKDTVNVFEERGDLLLINGRPAQKMRPEDERNESTEPFWGFISKEQGTAESAKKELTEVLNDSTHGFQTVKPEGLIRKLIFHASNEQDIILDFFAGSGTTAHAVMELNAEDGGTRQSISVQYPEPVDEKSEAYKAGYRTIADITRARIQKVIEKLQTEQPEKAKDVACAHFTLAPSNFKIWQTELDDGHALRSQLEAFQDGPLDSDTSQDAQRAKLSELFLKLGLGALGVHAVNKPKTLPCGITIHRVMPDSDRRIFFCFEPYQDVLKDEVIAGRATQLVLLNACFQGAKADEQLSNLKLELAGLDIDLVVI